MSRLTNLFGSILHIAIYDILNGIIPTSTMKKIKFGKSYSSEILPGYDLLDALKQMTAHTDKIKATKIARGSLTWQTLYDKTYMANICVILTKDEENSKGGRKPKRDSKSVKKDTGRNRKGNKPVR